MGDQWGWFGFGFFVNLDDRYKVHGDSWLQSGPVIGVADQTEQEGSKKPIPKGTRVIGHLWVVPEKNQNGAPGHLVVRYDRVEFPNGDKAPVCLVHQGNPVLELKDGAGRVKGTVGRVSPVRRWKYERPEVVRP
jgi:hypothetical protein